MIKEELDNNDAADTPDVPDAEDAADAKDRLVLRFGIPSLDTLLGHPRVDVGDGKILSNLKPGVGINSLVKGKTLKQDTVSVCLIGIDGVGKSILAMHMAARYRADVNEFLGDARKDFDPLVLYASTDLTFGRADVSWRNFGLNCCPGRIDDPYDISHVLEQFNVKDVEQTELSERLPLDDGIWEDNEGHVHFIDLATHTTGDDWGYINRLIGSLPPPEPHQPKHLMIVDAVEGLEVLVGDIDAFGQRRDRRSRVAQLIRTAAGKCHLVFLVEANNDGTKTPEEFIADAVIHLGTKAEDGYLQRFVQVEKVRAQAHVPGPHALIIRDGRGSTTGESFNADDPPVIAVQKRDGMPPFALEEKGIPAETRNVSQSYVYVLHSLNLVNRQIMKAKGQRIESSTPPLASFGIENLDGILEARDFDRNIELIGDPRGISTADPVALIGEDQTYKSKLSKAFLAQAKRKRDDDESCVAILITTKTLERAGLIERLERHLGEKITDRHHVFCRRLEVHTQTGESLFHVISQAVKRAQATLLLELDANGYPKDGSVWQDEEKRRKIGWRVRLVIDNWTAIRDMYPLVERDPLFLPCLMFFLRREGIATLIVGNEARGFTAQLALKATRRLRELTAMQLFTWRVPYFGESRVAITVTPQQNSGQGSFTRELKVFQNPQTNGDKFLRPPHLKNNQSWKVAVGRAFELYEGLEKGEDPPRYVPLRVHLYAGSQTAQTYIEDIRFLFEKMTNASEQSPSVICDEDPGNYERLREFTELQGVARYPYTLVLQVDEFWSRSHSMQLQDQHAFLDAETSEVSYRRDNSSGSFVVDKVYNYITDDPFHLFQPTEAMHVANIASLEGSEEPLQTKTLRRSDFFSTTGYDLPELLKREPHVQKVPYAWDFGFLMVNRTAWQGSSDHRNTWDQFTTLDTDAGATADPGLAMKGGNVLDWRKLAEQCNDIALARNRSLANNQHHYVPFAVAPEIQETISCLFFEIWASEIDKDLHSSNGKMGTHPSGHRHTIDDVFPHSREEHSIWNLAEILTCFNEEAHRALLIMAALLPPEVMTDENIAKPQNEGNRIPVAFRTWYSAAHTTQEPRRVNDIYIPARLPGSRSVRGDWFLATARGSRSYQMGERAIDLLTSRRANILRLQYGIGLPVRDANQLATENDSHQELWTPLWHHDESDNRTHKVKYHELVQLGMREGEDAFRWLWRSRIRQYDRHARLLRRWICSTLRQSNSLLDNKPPLEAYNCAGSQRFKDRINSFVESLNRATISDSVRKSSIPDPLTAEKAESDA